MPRTARATYKGAIYHIMLRGNNKQGVFRDKSDREMFLQVLKKYQKKYSFKLYGYCMMDEHIHLIIHPVNGVGISSIMQGINLRYTMYFNWKYSQAGHLFGGRYHSVIVDKDSCLTELTRYIHMNPVKSGIVENPSLYPWSSYQDFVSCEWPKDRFHGIGPHISRDDVLNIMDCDEGKQLDAYKEFVAGVTKTELRALESRIRSARILGAPEFVEKVRNRLNLAPVRRRGRPRKVNRE